MKSIISASRRTDLPRIYPHWLAEAFVAGKVGVKNPFNQKERIIDLSPDKVHSMVFWSKDYSAFIANQADIQVLAKRYDQLFFHFTVTGLGGTLLEPGIIPENKAISQFDKLIKIAGHEKRVNWRFDPIVFWQQDKPVRSNLRKLDMLAKHIAATGIQKMTFSLCQWYRKSQNRARKYHLKWIAPKKTRIKGVALFLSEIGSKYNIKIEACCTEEVIPFGISKAKCIDGKLLEELHPKKEPAEPGKDKGQRRECGCTPSLDIGSYALACPDGCVYCYANPKCAK